MGVHELFYIAVKCNVNYDAFTALLRWYEAVAASAPTPPPPP